VNLSGVHMICECDNASEPGIRGIGIYKAQPCQMRRSAYANLSPNGNTLYKHIHFSPGSEARIIGLRQR
jgi:hypothetical protein